MKNIIYLLLPYILKFPIRVVSLFFMTYFYFVFILLIIFGLHCQLKSNVIHICSQWVVLFTMYSAFSIFVLLNIPLFGDKIQDFIGKPFLNYYLPGPLKGGLAFTFFLFTVTVIGYIDTHSLSSRILEYNSIVDSINDSLELVSTKEWGTDFLKDLQTIESNVFNKIPKKFPSTGILTDFSDKALSCLEQKK